MTVTSMTSTRRRISISVEDRLLVMADAAIRALANLDVFQRGGQLVDIVRDATSIDGIARTNGSPRLRPIPAARLRELLESATDCSKRADGGAKQVRPPKELIETVMARGQWPLVRTLTGVTNWPVLRPDGTILGEPGYDPRTGIFCDCDVRIDIVSEPNRADAQAALAALLDLLSEFPFVAEHHRTAWLAIVLAVLARPAIDGPVPMTLISASQRGSGKTLLADIVGAIICDKPLPRRTAPAEKAEWDKTMLAIALAGDAILLVDNVASTLRSDALDAVLTGTEYRGRVLGRNEELTLPVTTVFVVTANNATLSPDLVRRAVEVRLEPTQERPEARGGFRYGDLIGHCQQHRTELLGAALTILRAYVVAGRPKVKLRPMGSYEAWSREVRAPLVWLGLPDPATTQDTLRETADLEHELVREVLSAIHAIQCQSPFTVRQLLNRVEKGNLSPDEVRLRDALAALCETDGQLPSSQKLGTKLRGLRSCVSGSLCLTRPLGHSRDGAVWRIQCTPQDSPSGDDGEHGEHGDDESNQELVR